MREDDSDYGDGGQRLYEPPRIIDHGPAGEPTLASFGRVAAPADGPRPEFPVGADAELRGDRRPGEVGTQPV